MAEKRDTTRVGKRGTVVIPADLRRRYGLTDGALLVAEGTDDGILLRPAVALPIEIYSPRRKAELLLENAVDDDDYARAAEEVRKLPVDPEAARPPGKRRGKR
jgi:AbrB family looped-hinge helix DNA binding protein